MADRRSRGVAWRTAGTISALALSHSWRRGKTGPSSVACVLEGALQKANRLSARADQGDAYIFPAAAEASQAHVVDEHAGALQRRAVADTGNPSVFER